MKVSAHKSSFRRPKGYKGRLYKEVTEKHWAYLEALANCKNHPVPWNPDWKEAYKDLTGLDSRLPPRTMTSGVFEARGWIWIEKRGKRSPLWYGITPEGRAALGAHQAEDQRSFRIEEAERLDEVPPLPKREAEPILQRFQAFAPKISPQTVRKYERSEVGRALKALYNGHCQICGFTFSKRDGSNYAEVHHLEALSEGGWEDPKNMLVVCANCHRQLHYGSVERVGWENDQLVLKLNGKIHHIQFHPSHLVP